MVMPTLSYGLQRLGSRGNNDDFRILPSAKNNITTRSSPMPEKNDKNNNFNARCNNKFILGLPAPPCGGAPNLKASR